MEMIFNYGDQFYQYPEDGSCILQPKSFIFGQITSFLEIAPSGVTGIVATRFSPEGLTPFIDVPVSSLENRAAPIAEIFGEKGISLEKQVLTASDNNERKKIIETFLLSRLEDPHTIDMVTKTCVDTIFQTQGQLGVTELADKMHLNRRNMERKFIAAIGMSPKQLSKVVRLQSALKMLEQKKYSSLTDLAYESGYYDQAHFIKDFHEFAGISPKSFFADNMKLSALFVAAE
ncbi:MAG: helix-turn-helix domain-containing protein, partial [Chitinophagaceae bacterium]